MRSTGGLPPAAVDRPPAPHPSRENFGRFTLAERTPFSDGGFGGLELSSDLAEGDPLLPRLHKREAKMPFDFGRLRRGLRQKDVRNTHFFASGAIAIQERGLGSVDLGRIV